MLPLSFQLLVCQGVAAFYVTALTARLTKRLPDFATDDAVLPADFTTDRTVFFAAAILPLLDDFLAGFLAATFFDFDRAGLRAMESSSQWLPRKTLCRKPRRSGGLERQGHALGQERLRRKNPSCVGVIRKLQFSSRFRVDSVCAPTRRPCGSVRSYLQP